MNKLDMIDVCPICRKRSISHLTDSTWSQNDRYLLEMLEMNYVPASWFHCAACNHVFLNPSFSSDIEKRLYGSESIYRNYSIAGKSDEEYLSEIDPTVKNKLLFHTSHLRRLRQIKMLINMKKIVCVDFGAGFGAAESAVESLGWDYYGFEKDTWCLNKAVELGRRVLPNLPEGIRAGGADLVYSSQVFEHIKNPNEVAGIINTILKPGGYIFIDVPTHAYELSTISSIGPGGLRCMNWGHYHSYTPDSLSHMLTNWGFSVIRVWLKSGDVNILAKKMDTFQSSIKDEPTLIYSTAVERLKIQTLRWILNPLKLLFIDFPANTLRSFIPRRLRERVRNTRF